MNLKRKLLSQNFFRDPALVARLVGRAHFNRQDTVIDIGAGRGIITEQLAKVSGKVIAVEIDPELVSQLRLKFRQERNVEIHEADIRQLALPVGSYKIFANLPFSITADIIYKLLYYSNPPTEAYLIVQKEAAAKFSGVPAETQFSLLSKPWFSFEVAWQFRRSNFVPEPDVDSVLLKINKRAVPLVGQGEENLYKNFIKFAFSTWKKDLKPGLAPIFTYRQWQRLAHDNGFAVHSRPTELSFDQWLAVFRFLVRGVGPEKLTTLV